ncbi:MAG: hypothetical protein M3Q23_02645 [Actinomycetota bacterium]|nr:hypothetical protein [Actinomycetota bacterium]
MTAYFVAALVMSAGAAVSLAASAWGYAAVGTALSAILLLLVHQRVSRWALASGILTIAAFVAPALLVRPTWSSDGCHPNVICDSRLVGHPGPQIALLTALLAGALGAAVAVAGLIRSRTRSSP